MLDLMVQGGILIDGTGADWFEADIGVRQGRIAAMGDLRGWRARRTIRLQGQVVAPGFIDIHGHSDLALLANPLGSSKLLQGVTTEVVGNCGDSAAPLMDGAAEVLAPDLERHGLTLTWRSMGEYLDQLQSTQPSLNVVALVGLGTARQGVVGDANRPPTPADLAAMQELVDRALAEGAFGISSGLIYPPGCFASTEELVALARVAAQHRTLYATHLRDEADHVVDAVAEALAIGEQAGVRVQISHHKAEGPGNWGKVRTTTGMMAEARRRGIDVTMDQYPYSACSTRLYTLLPAWTHDGGTAAMLARLQDPDLRPRIAVETEAQVVRNTGTWNRIYLSALPPAHAYLSGRHLEEVAALLGVLPAEALMDMVLQTGGMAKMFAHSMDEEDIRHVMRQPLTMVASDGNAIDAGGVLAREPVHPRFYGTFPRVLARYVREQGMLSLPEAIRKMTALPAGKLGLWDRGLLRPGMAADLVIFDPDRVRDRATFSNPHQYPKGLLYVAVNGTLVVEVGQHTGARPGRVLRRGAGRDGRPGTGQGLRQGATRELGHSAGRDLGHSPGR